MRHVSQQHLVRMKTGVKRDGTIVANQMVLLTSTGAYATHPLITQGRALLVRLRSIRVPICVLPPKYLYTNTPPSAALRGYGAPAEFFALESHMDEIARQVGIDALELRRKNWIRIGDAYPLQKTAPIGREAAIKVDSCALACLLAKS